jgi:long-chain fatty acid transport protein
MRTPCGILAASSLLLVPWSSAHASLGPYEHGAGIKSQGAGGISYAFGEEATVISINPAIAAALDTRLDIGVNLFIPSPRGEIENNLFGADEGHDAKGQRIYPIPQAGGVRHLDDRWTVAVSLFSAGLGPDYEDSPYARFGGASRASLTLVSSGAVLAIAWKPTQDQAFGLSVNPGYQIVDVKGLQFLETELPILRVSETPGRTTNQGKDGGFTIGATIGWHGMLTPTIAAGFAYRSKTWAQKHEEYRGLIPDRGRLELPAIWGGGIAWMPAPSVTLAFDFQRYELADEKALGNPFSRLAEGHLLGSKDGPGFGFSDLDAKKVGLAWDPAPGLTLRAGYVHANRPTHRAETLFNILASINATTHYTAGFTWALFDGWELSACLVHIPKVRVEGKNSIPLLFGGGEANTEFGVNSVGFSIGWSLPD